MFGKDPDSFLIHTFRPISPRPRIFFAMAEKNQENSREEEEQPAEQQDEQQHPQEQQSNEEEPTEKPAIEEPAVEEPPKEQKPDPEQDLTTFLSDSQCKDFTLLVATITERMRRSIEANFDASATVNKALLGDSNLSEEEKINKLDTDLGKVDVEAFEKEKKLLAEREKELAAPQVKQLKDDSLSNYDEWRLTFMQRLGEAVHLKDEAEKQIKEAGENYEAPPASQAAEQKGSIEPGQQVEQRAPKLDDIFPRVKTSLTKLSLSQRRLVLHSVLLLLISLERYSARSRVLLLYLTSSLKLGTKALQEEEIKIAKGLLKSAQKMNADKEAQEKVAGSEQSRKWKMRAATVAGAAVVGISGGMAAPMVASGVGAVMGGLGLGATAAAGCKLFIRLIGFIQYTHFMQI